MRCCISLVLSEVLLSNTRRERLQQYQIHLNGRVSCDLRFVSLKLARTLPVGKVMTLPKIVAQSRSIRQPWDFAPGPALQSISPLHLQKQNKTGQQPNGMES